ncbi:MAG: hypothetical protein LUE27_09950 [Clostridia bacterium]|nr:hypothetical protein [Clostridia bacterium]
MTKNGRKAGDGRGRLGGRQKGTPNKVTADVRSRIGQIVSEYFTEDDFKRDLQALEPKDRILVMEKLAAYVIPKLHSTSLEMATESRRTIEDILVELSEETEAQQQRAVV